MTTKSTKNPISSVATLANTATQNNSSSKAADFHFNEEEVRSIFQEGLSHSTNQPCVTVDSLHRTYHQYPNKLAFTSSVVRQGLDQFQTVFLQQENTTGLLSEEDFMRGLTKFEDMINKADNREEILQEIEALAVQIAGHDANHFSDLLHLPEILTVPEVENIMQSMDSTMKIGLNNVNSKTLSSPNPNNARSSLHSQAQHQQQYYQNQSNSNFGLTTPSPSGKVTSASIKRVSILSNTAPR